MPKALVKKSTGNLYTLIDENKTLLQATIRGKFRMKGIRSTNPVAVGDQVIYEQESPDYPGVITDILPRKNYIIRKSSNLSKESHILAANIDQAFLMITIAWPVTHSLFIDRFLVSAEAYRIPVKIVINKTDLYADAQQKKAADYTDAYEKAGYECITCSVETGENIDRIKKLMQNQISVIAGNSGVGKSSLIKTIQPGLDLQIKALSETHQSGKHTTTFAEMHALNQGGYIIDTPGIKGFGLVDIENNELSHFFPEIFTYSENCKYYNCTHVHEPGCAVKKAVEEEKIHPMRYQNYLYILDDEESKHR